MKLKNVSKEEQTVMPHTGPSFSCVPGAMTAEIDKHVARELLEAFPEVWEPEHGKTPKHKKAGDK